MTTKDTILRFLKDTYGHEGEWAGVISRRVHEITGTKESIVERRMRELVNEGKLDVCYKKISEMGPRCARYRISIK